MAPDRPRRTPAPGRTAARLAACLALALAAAGQAEIPLDRAQKLRFSGDLRLRLESDWDSRRPDGSPRPDRDRVRVRGRAAFTWAARPKLNLGLRLRTGSRASQQSPHVTVHDFGDQPRGDAHPLADQWYLEVRQERSRIWLGRTALPLWKQNEMVWDDDVTPAGVGFSHRWPGSEGRETAVHAGLFTLPDGGTAFLGRLAAAQVVHSARLGRASLTAAVGGLRFAGETGAHHLPPADGARDYSLGLLSLKGELPAAGKPLALGVDLVHNFEGYGGDGDRFAAAHRDERDGLVLSARLGGLNAQGDWQVGYTYARIETLAVHAAFAQDDWVRWGSATQTASSDLKGHELALGYAVARNLNLLARLFLVEAITSVQDGKRFRLDLNVRF